MRISGLQPHMAEVNGDVQPHPDDTKQSETGVIGSGRSGTAPPAYAHFIETPGTLLWVTIDGEIRELTATGTSALADLSPARKTGEEEGERSCRRCGLSALAETVVREHGECGRVAVDGFVRDDGRFGCPKCGTEAETLGRFEKVATVTACLACGDLLN